MNNKYWRCSLERKGGRRIPSPPQKGRLNARHVEICTAQASSALLFLSHIFVPKVDDLLDLLWGVDLKRPREGYRIGEEG